MRKFVSGRCDVWTQLFLTAKPFRASMLAGMVKTWKHPPKYKKPEGWPLPQWRVRKHLWPGVGGGKRWCILFLSGQQWHLCSRLQARICNPHPWAKLETDFPSWGDCPPLAQTMCSLLSIFCSMASSMTYFLSSSSPFWDQPKDAISFLFFSLSEASFQRHKCWAHYMALR